VFREDGHFRYSVAFDGVPARGLGNQSTYSVENGSIKFNFHNAHFEGRLHGDVIEGAVYDFSAGKRTPSCSGGNSRIR
jgi:hypothetical protein